MDAQNHLVNYIEKLFKQYEETVKRMYETSTLEEMAKVSKDLEGFYNELLKQLKRLRKEQKSDFDVMSKKIIRPISTIQFIVHENKERLDPNYNYEQGVLEENED